MFLAVIQKKMNVAVLGREDRPCSWRCPFDYKTKKITAISLNNVRTRNLIKNLAEELLPLCLEDTNEKSDWIQCIK
jgi:hypothetical protein